MELEAIREGLRANLHRRFDASLPSNLVPVIDEVVAQYHEQVVDLVQRSQVCDDKSR
jgi:hypothetical protein